MPSTFSTVLRLELQANGENASTWGTKANTVFNLIEQALTGHLQLNIGAAGTFTLTSASGSSDQSRNLLLELQGAALPASATVQLPTAAVKDGKPFVVWNNTTGTPQTVSFIAQGGTGVVVPQGQKMLVFCDGTNVVELLTFASNLVARDGSNDFAADTGAADAYVVTPLGPAPTLRAGLKVRFAAAHASTGAAATLNAYGTGVKTLGRIDGATLKANDITATQLAEAVYDGTLWRLTSEPDSYGTAAFLNVGTAAGNVVQLDGSDKLPAVDGSQLTHLPFPSGMIAPYGGVAAPSADWLLCDGSAVSRATYATLFGVIATLYGVGDGATTFNLPDFRGRTIVGSGTGPAISEAVAAASVDTAAETFTVPTNNDKWNTGQAVQLTTTGSLPTGLSLATTYFVIRTSATTIQFATTRGNAGQTNSSGVWNPVPVNLTSQGTGVHTVTALTSLTARTRGDVGGEEVHQLIGTEMSSAQFQGGSAVGVSGGAGFTALISPVLGGDSPHNTMQPYGVANFIIKT